MVRTQPLPNRGPLRDVLPADAQGLATALRRNRLTLLCGAPGAGKSALLDGGVMPLLRRRGDDVAVSLALNVAMNPAANGMRRPADTVLLFPDRRARGRAALAEMVVRVNASPRLREADLHDGIDAALRAAGIDPEWHRERLSERVPSLTSRFGTRFLFVLDGFEAVLQTSGDEAGDDDDDADDDAAPRDDPPAETRAALIRQLVRLLNLPVPANLLIALRTDAEILLAPMLGRLPDLRPEVLLLEGGRTRRVYGPATAPLAPPPPLPPLAPPPPLPPLPSPSAAPFDSARMPEAANAAMPAWFDEVTAPPPPHPPHPRITRRRVLTRGSIAVVALAACIGAAVLLQPAPRGGSDAIRRGPTEPLAAAPPATRARPAPATTAAPAPAVVTASPTTTIGAAAARSTIALHVDADNAAGRLPRELALALTADGEAPVQIVPTPLAVPFAGPPGAGAVDPAGLAIVRYDALQAASRAGTTGNPLPDLAVVAPLYIEELQIVVRADSPLQFIHQIEGKRLGVGPAEGARAVTAQALYRQMFDRPLPAAPQGRLDASAALQLLASGALDAVVLVGPQPAAALDALPLAQRRGLKMLALAPAHPASLRALQTYLPATLRDLAGGRTPSLAAMSFLVTTGRPDAETAAVLGRLATSWCRSLPALQRDGDAKWRALPAGLQLETGWPRAGAAEAAWRACAATPPTTPPTTPPAIRSPALPVAEFPADLPTRH